jgi:hypothetical protein
MPADDSLNVDAKKFPFLVMSGMSPEEKSGLIAKLEGESRTISLKFASLIATTGLALERCHVTAENLKLFLGSYSVKQIAESISSSDTITEAMTKVSIGNYWSFFNYELLEMVIATYCKSTDVIDHLEAYKSDFQVYCTRRLFEIPAILFENSSDSMLKFYIKTDNNFTVSVNDIKNIQLIVSKMLDVRPLYLIDVQKGCVKLNFGCFKNFEEIFPLESRDEIRRSLSQLPAVEYLQCGEVKIPTNHPVSTSAVFTGETVQEGPEKASQDTSEDSDMYRAELSDEEQAGM